MEFSFFKLNGVYYININGCHIIDYKHFINIQQTHAVNGRLVKQGAYQIVKTN
mgnify:CR=1 FL=1